MTPEELGDLATEMVPVASRLVGAVHDDKVSDVALILDEARIADPWRRNALLVVLAAMVDPDRRPRDLLAWVWWDDMRPMDPALFPRSDEPASLEPRTWSDTYCHARWKAYRRVESPEHRHDALDKAGFREWERRRRNARYHRTKAVPKGASTGVASEGPQREEEAS